MRSKRKAVCLLTHFRYYLVSAIGLLLLLLVVRFIAENTLLTTWQSDATHTLLLQNDVSSLQRSVLDQETGLRGYINTDLEQFLDPFVIGHRLYHSTLQQLKAELQQMHFQDSQLALDHEDEQATIWYNTFALVQLQDMRTGHMTIPRSTSEGTHGKILFDQFRIAADQLQTALTRDLHRLQQEEHRLSQRIFVVMMFLTLLTILFLAFSFKGFAKDLKTQLDSLQQTAQCLESGKLEARVGRLKHRELQCVGHTLNQMAHKLQLQQQELMTRALLIERASEYWALLNTVNTGLLFLSSERLVLLANEAFCDFFACNASDILGHPFEDLYQHWAHFFADPSAFHEAFALTNVKKEAMAKVTLVQTVPTRRDLELQMLPVSALQEHLLGSLFLFRDITQERELDRTKSEFISTVCHEFRTSLTGIQGFSELILDEASTTREEAVDFASEINADALRLTNLITDLLDLERMRSGKGTLQREPGDLNALLQDEAERTQKISTLHSFVLDLDKRLPAFPFDYDKIYQVVRNLVSNAVKYSPQGGEIVIRSRIEGTVAHISIQDQGVGIPAEALEWIFDPYSRIYAAKTRYIEGTGLGLAIVREIVQFHKGQTWAESSVGKGAKLHFTLPLNPQFQSPQAGRERMGVPAASSEERVPLKSEEVK